MSAEEKNSDEIKEWKEKLELLRDVENFKTKVRKSTSIEDIEEYLNEEWKNTEMTKQEKQLSLRQISVKVLRDYMASIDWENQTDREIAEFKVAMHHLNRTWYDLLKAERKLKDIPYYLSDKKKKKKREKRLDEVRFAKWCYCGELRNNFNWGDDPAEYILQSAEWDSIKTFNTLGTDKLKDTDFNNASCLSWGEFDFELEK